MKIRLARKIIKNFGKGRASSLHHSPQQMERASARWLHCTRPYKQRRDV